MLARRGPDGAAIAELEVLSLRPLATPGATAPAGMASAASRPTRLNTVRSGSDMPVGVAAYDEEAINRYPPDQPAATDRLMAEEFVALGCSISQLGPLTQITKEGKTWYTQSSVTSFTSRLAIRILGDKALTKEVLRRADLNVVPGAIFAKHEKAAALEKVREFAPAVVKPVGGQRGIGVSVNVNPTSFEIAWSAAEAATAGTIMVEQYVDAPEARYLVVDGACVAVLHRAPPRVRGDGESTIAELIAKQNGLRKKNPNLAHCPIKLNPHREEILREQGYTPRSIPPAGAEVIIDWKSGLSTGGTSHNITPKVHDSMKRIAERVAASIPGLDVIGVDILASDHTAPAETNNYAILEANTEPMLGGHRFPMYGQPINVHRLVAESCLRRMGFDVAAMQEALPSPAGQAERLAAKPAGSGAPQPVGSGKRTRSAPLVPATGVSKDVAEDIVRASVSHLMALIRPSGKFVYAHKQFFPDETQDGYNLLRHCGTVWFLCKAIRTMAIDLMPDQQRLLGQAVAYIQNRTKEPPWASGVLPVLCLTSMDIVKLGGVGLAALMLREYAELGELSKEPLSSLYPQGHELACARLENYIISQLSDGDFIHKRAFSSGIAYPFRSEYYTGEALFALVRSSRNDPQVRRAMEGLFEAGYGLAEQSHWMAYAACTALRTGYGDRARTINYLERLIDRIIADASYRDRYESTPIACRTEALVVFLQTCRLMDEEAFPEALIAAAREAARTNLGLQLAYYGDGQFRKGRDSDKVQIDYIQHNGTAFLGWWELSEE